MKEKWDEYAWTVENHFQYDSMSYSGTYKLLVFKIGSTLICCILLSE